MFKIQLQWPPEFKMNAPTYHELIKLLGEAEGATASQHSTAELLTSKFCECYPLIQIGRPGRFLETVRRIDGPISTGKLKGSSQILYL